MCLATGMMVWFYVQLGLLLAAWAANTVLVARNLQLVNAASPRKDRKYLQYKLEHPIAFYGSSAAACFHFSVLRLQYSRACGLRGCNATMRMNDFYLDAFSDYMHRRALVTAICQDMPSLALLIYLASITTQRGADVQVRATIAFAIALQLLGGVISVSAAAYGFYAAHYGREYYWEPLGDVRIVPIAPLVVDTATTRSGAESGGVGPINRAPVNPDDNESRRRSGLTLATTQDKYGAQDGSSDSENGESAARVGSTVFERSGASEGDEMGPVSRSPYGASSHAHPLAADETVIVGGSSDDTEGREGHVTGSDSPLAGVVAGRRSTGSSIWRVHATPAPQLVHSVVEPVSPLARAPAPKPVLGSPRTHEARRNTGHVSGAASGTGSFGATRRSVPPEFSTVLAAQLRPAAIRTPAAGGASTGGSSALHSYMLGRASPVGAPIKSSIAAPAGNTRTSTVVSSPQTSAETVPDGSSTATEAVMASPLHATESETQLSASTGGSTDSGERKVSV